MFFSLAYIIFYFFIVNHLLMFFVSSLLYSYMQRKTIAVEKQCQKIIDDTLIDPKLRARVASLAPYLAQIQRRKKLRALAKKSKKNLNQSSSRSFRIKENSVTSLPKDPLIKNRQMATNNLVTRLLEQRGNRQRRTQSVQRCQDFQYSKTIEHRPNVDTPISNTFFNDLYVRVKSKAERERPQHKKLYQTLKGQRARSQQAGEINVLKITHSNQSHALQPKVAKTLDTPHSNPVKEEIKRQGRKGNFRRNKYEALHSSTAQRQVSIQKKKDQVQSDSRIELDKKQSNVSINRQMDKIAQRQMENFYIQVRNKEIHRSVQRSTQNYFNSESYRPPKSKNDIEVIVSTAKNPSLHKVSHSTTTDRPINSSALVYDFDFHNQDPSDDNSQINEIENPSDQQSSFLGQRERVFEIGPQPGQIEGVSWNSNKLKETKPIGKRVNQPQNFLLKQFL